MRIKELLVTRLGDILLDLPVPESDEARERAVALAPSAVGPPDLGAPPRFAIWRRVPASVGVALLLVALFLAATPPGRSAVSWAGELVGIGEVGGPPTLDQDGRAAPYGEAIVFETGTAPNGEQFEIVAYQTRGLDSAGLSIEPEVKAELSRAICVSLQFPVSNRRHGEICYTGRPTEREVRVGVISASPDVPFLIVQGEANARTSAVEVIYRGPEGEELTVPATVVQVSGELGERIGVNEVSEPTAFFWAFLPMIEGLARGGEIGALASGAELTAVATDAGGNQIGTDTYSVKRLTARPAIPNLRERCPDIPLRGSLSGALSAECRNALRVVGLHIHPRRSLRELSRGARGTPGK
jgi:hypothetical protein